jgi:cyclopropane-fatty-acyl-phospholipid synthase
MAKLAGLEQGALEVHDCGHIQRFGRVCDGFEVPVVVTVRDPAFYSELAFGGTIGAGESYMLGHWQCSNLVDLVRMMARNRQVLSAMDGGMGRLMTPLNKVFHWLHRNTVAGSRRNIHAHYDLGNDFFKRFLDNTMMYSAGIFETPEATMEQASIAKLERICRKLDLGPDDHVLEIGTGWGGFAIHAATHYGCRVTTTTISSAQYELAQERVVQAGLSDRITLLKEDFRNLEGQYDKLVSIEMIEAIGEANIGTFFAVCNDRLKPDGKMLLQAITIADELYDRYRKSVDFIQRYIFPGGFLPSVGSLCQQIARHSDLRLFHMDDIGPHYATTLQRWREAFFHHLPAIREQGFPPEFIRMWEFYFCYCEGGFIERTTGDVQMLLVKSGDRSPSLLTV